MQSNLFDITRFTCESAASRLAVQGIKIAGPRKKSQSKQPLLFENERRITTRGQACYAIGNYFEEWAEELTTGTRLETTTAADICPDLQLQDGRYVEVKSAGCSNQAILYLDRCRRYDDFVAEGNRVVYMVFNHTVVVEELAWESDLAKLRQRCKAILFVDAEVLHRKLYQTKPRQFSGVYARKQQRVGWTIHVSKLLELA